MKGKTERDGWKECGREKGMKKERRKRGQREIKIHGNGEKRDEGREGKGEEIVCVLRGVNHGCWLMDGSRF